MKDVVFKRTAEEPEVYTDERCHITELLNGPEDRTQSIAQARVEPGITTSRHQLKATSEIYYILQGQGTIKLGDDYKKDLKTSDMVYIPADKTQQITNTGKTDLIFLCICNPAFEPGCYIDVEPHF